MSTVELTGQLICRDEQEAMLVRLLLPKHLELTRAETGCLRFEVVQTGDPLVWDVSEVFADEVSFDLHQKRVRSSGWGRATAGIVRDYVIALGEE